MKDSLRKQLETLRSQLGEDIRREKSMCITSTLMDYLQGHSLKTVASFSSFRNEVHTHAFNQWLIDHGYTLLLPYIHPVKKEMLFYAVKDLSTLMPSPYGILEPNPNHSKEVTTDLIDLVVTPGLGFDTLGYRIGYGGGYYDKLFSTLMPHTTCVGIAFDTQVLPQLPREAYDLPVHILITETRLYDFD